MLVSSKKRVDICGTLLQKIDMRIETVSSYNINTSYHSKCTDPQTCAYDTNDGISFSLLLPLQRWA